MKIYRKHIGSEVIFLVDAIRIDNYKFPAGTKAKIIDVFDLYPKYARLETPEGEMIDIRDYHICRGGEQTSISKIQIVVDSSEPNLVEIKRILKRFNTKIAQLEKKSPKDMMDFAEIKGAIKAYKMAIKIVKKDA